MEGMVFEDLAKLLEPCLSKEFLESTWGKSFRYVHGWPKRFAELLPWNHLNHILSSHRLDFPRLRLMQDGKGLPTSSYIRHTSSGKGKPSIPRLRSVEVTKHLRNGATLVLDAVDELQEPIRQLANGLERVFHERIQVNCYAGWKVSSGFDLHWDNHDVFILQVTGRKRWNVYGMTKLFPLTGDNASVPKPAHDPLWTGIMEDGDLLYIPRGWWHVAIPLDEPTLHLTVGVHNRTGIDLLQWSAEKLRECEVFRQDLPRFASNAEREDRLTQMRQELIKHWDSNLIERYFADLDEKAEPRASFDLPWSVTSQTLPRSEDTIVRLNTSRSITLETSDGVVAFACNGKRWSFDSRALNILQLLAEHESHSILQIYKAAKSQLDEKTIRTFLGELLVHGLIVTVKE